MAPGNNPNGITGLVNINGVLVNVGGSYLINPDGSLEVELAFSNGKRESLTGRVAVGQGTIVLDTPAGTPDITILTSDVGRPARSSAVGVSGNLALFGVNKTGSLTLDGNSNVTAGSLTHGSTLQVVAPGAGSVYQIVPGTVNMTLTTQANGTGVAAVTNFAGGVTSRGDLLALNEFTTLGRLTQTTGLDLLVTHAGNFANANLAGTWNIDAEDFRGSVAFNKSGAVAGGTITLNDGEVLPLTGGGAAIDATGGGTLNLITASSTVSLSITMAVREGHHHRQLPRRSDELTILDKSSGTYAPTEIAGTSWRLGQHRQQRLAQLQRRRRRAAKITVATGQVLSISGTYKLQSDGSVVLTVTLLQRHDADPHRPRQRQPQRHRPQHHRRHGTQPELAARRPRR